MKNRGLLFYLKLYEEMNLIFADGKAHVLLNGEKQMMPRKKEMGSMQKRDSTPSQNEDGKLDVLLGV